MSAAEGSLMAALAPYLTWKTVLAAAVAAALLLNELRMWWVLRGVTKPGRQWPLVGIGLTAMKAASEDDVVRFMHEECKKADFKTVGFRIFNQAWIIGLTPKHVQHMFGTRFDNYIKGPTINDAFLDILGDSIFTTDGRQWKEQRHVASHLFTAQQLRMRMRSVFERRGKQLAGLVSGHAKQGGFFDLQRYMYCYTFDAINEIAFGRAVDSLGGDQGDRAFQEAFDRAQARAARRLLTPAPAWKGMRVLPFGPEAQMRSDVRHIDSYLRTVIRERRERGEAEGDGRDLISLFIESCEKEGKDYTDKELRDLIMSFVIAGRDTTASLLTWTFSLLCKHPKVLERLRKDVVEHDGDYDGMQWAQAVLQEALRLYPSVPLEFKFARGPDTLPCGTKVHPGTRVMFNPYSHCRNPDNFNDPDDFIPERWLESDGTCRRYDLQGFSYPPFNAGPRVCLGRNMAMLEAKVVLSYLVNDFDFTIEPGFEPAARFTVVLASKNGLSVKATERCAEA
eukprot:TRINITY_DN403_c0_g1_i2.p1 TRINITY_DN403_c0_g1~~TRINITY_DN403_c0_g1_i2.p1  ORF type:complete len:539 (+),score=228.20 TRINITY_DN403_c0_g1_i2:94-1617(+)